MEQKELKTSLKQRIFISIIAILMLGSTIATYIMIVMNSQQKAINTNKNAAQLAAIQKKISDKQTEATAIFNKMSDQYFATFSAYKSEIKAFNATTANEKGLVRKDLKVGEGTEIGENDYNYMAYYIGYCANEEIFDSSLNSNTKPTALKNPLAGSPNMIAGWLAGVVGMKPGGVRQITVPGELAYKDTQEICGGTYSPLRFIIMTVKPDPQLEAISKEISVLQQQYQAFSGGM